ncbi:MAG: oligopeptide transporter, OPT family [Clostridia bacterium]|nr:oligopeptide transporter, OPT family [Clostridia bacterium]
MNDKNNFKPYIPAEKITPEITVTSIIVGVFLAIVFGAANAYLGLRVGMTVSASVPAAVISMGIIRVALRRDSILENNIVQTIGSAGESVAAGAIFTLPALFLWAAEGKADKPQILELTLIALIGGLLGVFFMIPLRNALIVKEHGILPYPEGTACAEVLMAGEKSGASASTVFAGMGLAALYKFIIDGLKVVSGEISLRVKGFAGEIGTQIYPAVLSVGYICGPRISSYMFAGGVLSWLVLIPILVLFGENAVIYPATVSIAEVYNNGGAGAIWSNYIRYIGAGTLAAGGIISLIKSMPLIVKTFTGAIKGISGKTSNDSVRTQQDIGFKTVLITIVVLTLAVWLIPAIPVGIFGAGIIVIFGFFFAAVSSRMVGLVGGSNNPVSGMAIATLLVSSLILKISGNSGITGMISAISIGSVICIVSAISGDTSQDLKTGFILGATPQKQQIGEIIGVVFASLAIGGTLYLLDNAWGFGSEELGAPQATLMKLITEGVMEGNLPWGLVFCGVFIAVVVELVGVPVLPFAIGTYLPVHLNACIMIGGLIRLAVERAKGNRDRRKKAVNNGILFCSGMIAGEGIAGIILAVFALLGIESLFDMSDRVPDLISDVGGILLLLVTVLSVFIFIFRRNRNENREE